MKKVLVTGVAGFIGSNLAERLLAAGYEVIGLDNLAYGREEQIPKGVNFKKIDIRSSDIYPLFENVHTVFHLAAKNDLLSCQEDPVDTMSINVNGTTNVFEASRRAGVEKVVFASSSALEEGESRLKGFYAISKATCEKIADGYNAAFGLNYVILRYFNAFGPRQDYRRQNPPAMSAFIIKILKGEPPVLFEGSEENKRDFIYIDDINDFNLLCIEKNEVDNKIFRIGRGESTSIEEIWQIVKKISGSDLEPIVKPRPSTDVSTVTLADISEAKKISWQAKTSLEDGLRAQFEYLKDEFAKGNIK